MLHSGQRSGRRRDTAEVADPTPGYFCHLHWLQGLPTVQIHDFQLH